LGAPRVTFNPAMPPNPPLSTPLVFIHGDDDYAVKERARQVFAQWCQTAGECDQEIIDAQAAHAGEALQSIGRLREALNTLPFFGRTKVVWWRGCSFLGDDRVSASQAVNEAIVELAQEMKAFPWPNVQLLISAGKVDKRKSFYKALEKTGTVEVCAAWSAETKNWQADAADLAGQILRRQTVSITEEALEGLISSVGPNRAQLVQELEKVVLYAGQRGTLTVQDVEAVVVRNKQARAFALGDALGDRDLPRLLRTLDEELWELRSDRQRSEIGLLYGLISKVRMMIFLKELQREKWVQPTRDYTRFKAQLDRIPADLLPEDRRFNPLAMNPYPLFRAMQQAENYSLEELVQAMDLLLDCNQRLISSSLDGGLVLQQTVVQIVRSQTTAASPVASR
jgi:DNA polymerase-3 subunit delta